MPHAVTVYCPDDLYERLMQNKLFRSNKSKWIVEAIREKLEGDSDGEF